MRSAFLPPLLIRRSQNNNHLISEGCRVVYRRSFSSYRYTNPTGEKVETAVGKSCVRIGALQMQIFPDGAPMCNTA
jgi:hypothetical protein